MKRLAVATLTLGVAMSSFPAAPAFADHLDPFGPLCGFASVADPGAEPGTQTGQVNAGPAVLDDGANPPGVYSGYFTCTIQVNAPTHAGADAAVVVGPETPVVIAAAGPVTYSAGSWDTVYLCTQVDADGETLYYDDSNDPLVDGTWSTSPTARCALSTSLGSDPGPGPGPFQDPLLCPLFALAFPPEGDVVLPGPIGKIWDCPPYDV